MQTSFVLDAGGYYAVARVGARKGIPLPHLLPLASLTDSSERGIVDATAGYFGV